MKKLFAILMILCMPIMPWATFLAIIFSVQLFVSGFIGAQRRRF